MPIINDFPVTIYVRDINEQQGEAFAQIKKKFNLTSNNEVVKTLFIKYLQLEEQRNSLQKQNYQLHQECDKQHEKLNLLKETFEMLRDL